jgi:hypothetical protein
MLQTIAKMTDGAYYRASDGAAIAEACAKIDAFEKDRISSFQYRRHHEAFAWFILAALACWCGVLGLEATLWRRVP